MLQFLFILAGTLSLGLGILGIFVPGLPTTPFVLLTAALYVKSSPFLYNKLVSHKTTGRYLNNFRAGISLKTRIILILIMWLMILTAVFGVIESWKWKLFIIIMGIAGTLIKLCLPGKKKNPETF